MKQSPTQKQRVQAGTAGTPRIHAGSRDPDGFMRIGNNREHKEISDLMRIELPACYAHEIDHSADALVGIVAEVVYRLGWDNPRLTPVRLAESIRAGRVTVSPGDLLPAAGWQLEDMARAFGIVRSAWAWIVAEVEERAGQDHGWLFVPAVPTKGGACGNTESLVAQGLPVVPTVPDEIRMNRND